MRKWIWLIIGGVILAGCVVCGGLGLVGQILSGPTTATPAVARLSTAAVEVVAEAALPPEASATPISTSPPSTATPVPPSPTPLPTEPPPTATPVPEPISLSGSGDAVERVDKWPGPAIVQAAGNAGAAHFAITPYDASGEMVDLLVNTTSPYAGSTWLPAESTRLEITAEGEWSIDILPLASAIPVPAPGLIEGDGDAVMVVEGAPDIATVRGNEVGDHFAIMAYDEFGQMVDLLVNTVDPYDGQVIVDRDAKFLVLTGSGAWSIQME